MDTTMHKAVCIIAVSVPPDLQARKKIRNVVSLTRDQVLKIAMLARLQFSDAEIDDVVDKLSRIVDFVDQLQAAATDDVLPMAHPLNMSQRLRADEVTEVNERDDIQKNAPKVEDGYYLVPKVLE
jgi:aspartyl-tRNA(Asn)/glutamyl-tRNA(Gln) amidotransferase subunit C